VRDWALYAAVTAAAILLVFQFMLNDDPGNTAQDPPQQETENPAPPEDKNKQEEPNQESPEGEQEEQPDPEADEKQQPVVNRPQTKEIVTYPEGTEERLDYYLFTHEAMPFSTYIYPEWEAEVVSRNGRDGGALRGVYIAPPQYDYGEMEILFFPEGTQQNDVEKYVLDNFVQNNQYQQYQAENGNESQWYEWEIQEWALVSYRYFDDVQGRNGYVHIGEHDGQLFLIRAEYGELAEAFPHRSAVVYQEWIWTDTGEPLQQQ
jgi:hypothetical protein